MLRRGIKLASFCLALVIFTVSLAISTPALAGAITLYEGNGGQQDVINMYFDRPDFNGTVSPNDEARSAVLNDVAPLTKITVYDDPNGAENDDYTVIKVKKQTPSHLVIGTFEANIPEGENPYVVVDHHHNNGLDGKVSRIKIESFNS